MNNTQKIHIGMINSYNLITGKATMSEIANSGVGFFAHYPGEKNEFEAIEFMIYYFKNLEMYEKCSELQKYIDRTFNSDGTHKEPSCDCDLPSIEEYVPTLKCSVCNLRISRY